MDMNQTLNGDEESPRMEIELVIIRHGITQWNAERRYLGHTDLPLLPSALESLKNLKNQLSLSGRFSRVYCSDLLRCRETLAYLAPSLQENAVYDKRLREMNFGDWEGSTYEELKENRQYRSWLDDPASVTPPNGESWDEFAGRVQSFLSECLQSTDASEQGAEGEDMLQRILIMTHGGVIRAWLGWIRSGLTFREAEAPPPGTATIVKLIQKNGHWIEAPLD